MPGAVINFDKPEKLARWQVVLFGSLLPLLIALFTTGALALQVLLDKEKASWLAGTQFAAVVNTHIRRFPFLPAMLINVCLVGAVFLGGKLYEHSKALRLERQAAAQPPKKEAKKTK